VLTIVVIADPVPSLLPGHDTSVALMEAAQRRGHRILVTTAADLGVRDGRAHARCQPLEITPARLVDGHWRAPADWWRAGAPEDMVLDRADAVLMRTDPPVDDMYLRATYLLDYVNPRHTLLVNAPAGLREANEKLFTLRFRELIPDTLISADLRELAATVGEWGQAVLKPTDAMGGRGILLLRPGDLNLRSALEISTDRGRRQVILQRWVPAAAEGDRRVIVLGGEPVGVIRRVAVAGEFRCNMAAGAAVVADSVSPRDKEICDILRPELTRLGIVLAGIDVIGDRLTEINVTSPTGVREIDASCGTSLAQLIIEHFEQRCHALGAGRSRTP
jgi:glutathione synthase